MLVIPRVESQSCTISDPNAKRQSSQCRSIIVGVRVLDHQESHRGASGIPILEREVFPCALISALVSQLISTVLTCVDLAVFLWVHLSVFLRVHLSSEPTNKNEREREKTLFAVASSEGSFPALFLTSSDAPFSNRNITNWERNPFLWIILWIICDLFVNICEFFVWIFCEFFVNYFANYFGIIVWIIMNYYLWIIYELFGNYFVNYLWIITNHLRIIWESFANCFVNYFVNDFEKRQDRDREKTAFMELLEHFCDGWFWTEHCDDDSWELSGSNFVLGILVILQSQ